MKLKQLNEIIASYLIMNKAGQDATSTISCHGIAFNMHPSTIDMCKQTRYN